MIDWGIGHYERTAAELAPVAELVVSFAKITPGERVLDLATGTGNAALLAAQSGAAVTGIDASPRLIDVARGRAAQARTGASFVVADLQALPFPGNMFDVALSVFGLIFAPDAERAFAEMIRVLRPDGRALVSACGYRQVPSTEKSECLLRRSRRPPARDRPAFPGMTQTQSAGSHASMMPRRSFTTTNSRSSRNLPRHIPPPTNSIR